MIPVLQALPLDWSGVSINNRTKGEIHNLGPQAGLPYRIIVMEKGYFYTNRLYMMDSRGYVLTENDYQCIVPSREVMDEVKMTACAVILITNPDVANVVRVDAQMVGGRFCSLNPAILETAINVMLSANRKTYWKDLTDKPNDYRPSGHLHALWDLYGFTEQTAIIKRMTTAIDKTVEKEFKGLFDEFLIEWNTVDTDLTAIENRLTTHISDHRNPHQVDRKWVGLEFTYNSGVATYEDALYSGNTLRFAYTTPLRTAQMVNHAFTPKLTEHVNDLGNPHQDTAAALGTLVTYQLQTLANGYYNRGETVSYTSRLQGMGLNDYTAYLRRNIPVSSITTGILNQRNYVDVPASNEYVLQPGADGYLTWKPFLQAIDPWLKKGNTILYAGSFASADSVEGNKFLTNTLGTNHPSGTIGVYRMSQTWMTFTGNGAVLYTTPTTTAMGVLLNGVWYTQPPAYSL